jgi:hypothetical protein
VDACVPGAQFEKAPPSPTANRVCQDYRRCDFATEVEAGFESPGGDRRCVARTVLSCDNVGGAPTEFESRYRF